MLPTIQYYPMKTRKNYLLLQYELLQEHVKGPDLQLHSIFPYLKDSDD